MRSKTVLLSLGEQIFASGFTFFLFLVAVRQLDQTALEIYTGLFSLNQSFSFFLFGLVLLPMASSAGEDAGKHLGVSIVLLVILLLVFALASPLAMNFFTSFEGRITPQLWLLALGFFASQCAYEAARWLTIRLKGSRSACPVTMTRFALFFSGMFLIGAEQLDATNFTLMQIVVNAMAVIGFTFAMRDALHEVHPSLPDRSAIRHLANLGTAVANFATNFATVILVDRGLGEAGLAAFQGLRSATNPIGLISQVIDNHFSAELARSGRSFTETDRIKRVALTGSAILLTLATLLGPQIVNLLFGDRFAEYWVLLPLLLMASLSHALTRPIFVKWRLADGIHALNMYSFVQITVVLPILAGLGWAGWTYAMVAFFALLPVTAVIVNISYYNKRTGNLKL
ncbi:hypothetical protein MKP05_20260 [Halomonas sp. EGI 63088]|uniref:Polysaccharide biosynthesis protein n=1 Tax=Halomonas flagellata TaxID=2920385 RepID=A0ABS9S019_9GAMM|nr:hypothetical protein [Halomonas flagellata]MCH4565437.1 hypothetical protein [Halomonas flagellata]